MWASHRGSGQLLNDVMQMLGKFRPTLFLISHGVHHRLPYTKCSHGDLRSPICLTSHSQWAAEPEWEARIPHEKVSRQPGGKPWKRPWVFCIVQVDLKWKWSSCRGLLSLALTDVHCCTWALFFPARQLSHCTVCDTCYTVCGVYCHVPYVGRMGGKRNPSVDDWEVKEVHLPIS